MVSSLISPVYGGAAFDDELYWNGMNPIPSNFGEFFDNQVIADDFVLEGGDFFDITDAHFTAFMFTESTIENELLDPLLYFFFEDNNGLPGNIIKSGTAQDTQAMVLGDPEDNRFEIWFNLEEPVTLDPGITYWFGLKYTDQFEESVEPFPQWELSDEVNGNVHVFNDVGPLPPDPNDWGASDFDMFFHLSGFIGVVDGVVGGEFLPIDSTALLLASAQSFSWMIPVVLSVLGIGLFVVSRKSENS